MGLGEMITLRCSLCGRFGRYKRDRYFEIAGTRNGPDALNSFAKAAGCERALKQKNAQLDNRCGIGYVLQASFRRRTK